MQSYRGIPAGYEDEDEDYADDFLIRNEMPHLKITIVPDITHGAGLNGQDFDSSLNAAQEDWLEEFKNTYNKSNRSPLITQQIKAVLMNDPQPLLLALKLFACSPGCNNLKNKNMALYILETVCELGKEHPKMELTCDDNTRMVAFNFIKTSGIVQLYEAVTKTYQLQKIQHFLIPELRNLLSNHLYKDVTYWSIILKCTHIFGLFDLIFPLILQDKVKLAEDFLSVATEQQLPTVQFLDTLLDRKKSVYDNCENVLQKYNFTDFNHSVLSYRPLSKLLTRLCKKYNIDAALTPNLRFSKVTSYLHYLFRKYKEGGMSLESWRELARDETHSNKNLQLALIEKITLAGELEEARYWAQLYELPEENYPYGLSAQAQLEDKSDISNNGGLEMPEERANQRRKNLNAGHLSVNEEYLRFQLPMEAVTMVNNKSKFLDMIDYLERFMVIGFDSEWKPSMNNDDRVSLIQLATRERVFLVDCLEPALTDNLWKQLGRRIFNNLEILKVGFSLHFDLRMLQKSLPLQLNMQTNSCYLDLRNLWRRMKYLQVPLPFQHLPSTGESLCTLTLVCLGKKLDKSNQCSNWANRPLRQEQITYAALDALCLILIYDVLSDSLLRSGINVDDLVDEVTTGKSSGNLLNKKLKVQTQCATSVSENAAWGNQSDDVNNIRLPSSIKFLCDSLLIGLSRELRRLGFDALEMGDNKCDTMSHVQLACSEQRILLIHDSNYVFYSNALSKELCLQIPSDALENQVLHILQHFQVQLDERHFCTRCVECNGNDFILANQCEMQLMRFGKLLNDGAAFTNADQPSSDDRPCNVFKINEHMLQTCRTSKGVPIKLNYIKPYLLQKKQHFYICDNCGYCTWKDASKWHKAIKEFKFTQATDYTACQATASECK